MLGRVDLLIQVIAVVLLELVVIVDQIAERKVQLSIRRLLFLPETDRVT